MHSVDVVMLVVETAALSSKRLRMLLMHANITQVTLTWAVPVAGGVNIGVAVVEHGTVRAAHQRATVVRLSCQNSAVGNVVRFLNLM